MICRSYLDTEENFTVHMKMKASRAIWKNSVGFTQVLSLELITLNSF